MWSVLAAVACGSVPADPADETHDVASELVQMVVQRDGLSDAAARAHIQDVARLAKAAHAEQDSHVDPPPLLTEARERFIRRAALARVWMHDTFETAHGAQDIPGDDPIFTRALASPKHVRPRLSMLCQIVAVPAGFDDRDAMLEKAQDPQWQASTKIRIEAIADRMQRYVRPEDPQACRLMGKLMRYENKDDGVVKLSVESKAFNLDACIREDLSGTCLEPKWAAEWVQYVRPHAEPGFIKPFRTRFGYHLVFLVQVLEPASAQDPATVAATRAAILGPWRAASYDRELDALRKKWAVKVVTGSAALP